MEKLKQYFSKKFILLSLAPTFVLGIVSGILMSYYGPQYNLNSTDLKSIWTLSRNFTNVIMVGIFLMAQVVFLVQHLRKKQNLGYLKFLIGFMIAMVLINYSYPLAYIVYNFRGAVVGAVTTHF